MSILKVRKNGVWEDVLTNSSIIISTQQTPLFANSIEECVDTSKVYVLPDGFIYAYIKGETTVEGCTNLVPTSIDTDGSIYNNTGYKENARLSSSGGVSGTAQAGSVVTGFIQFTPKDVIRIKGARWLGFTADEGHYYVNFYDSSKTFINNGSVPSSAYEDNYTNALSIVYDEVTGVTTFDINESATFATTIASAAYFRINAYGSGADLIVTVNEEIVESGVVSEYKWTNTGHAFVPADYEGRIIELEQRADDTTSDISVLKQQVSDIVDGSINVNASLKFDPTVYGLPVLDLTGDISPIKVSKDNKVTLNYVYGDRSGTCTLKGQGATSYKIAQSLGEKGKYNYTIKFDAAFEVVDGWGAQQKYCLKANWIDPTHSRNIVSCKLWGMSVKGRSTVPAELASLPNGGAIDGFPVVIMLNGEFHGLYTWNIPKDGWMFGLVEDTTKTQAIVASKDHTAATQFKEASMTGYEIEFASNEDDTTWIDASITQLINAIINSDGTDLDSTVAQYIDWDSVIDYLIHCVVEKATDCVDKNFLLVTFDGVKWYISNYDRDSIWCLNWDASGTTRPISNITFAECAATSRLFDLVVRFKTNMLKDRYHELRSNILSESRIMQTYENFAWAIPSPIMLEDVKRWPSILGSSVNTIDQIGRAVRQRLEVADAWIDAL